jgi:hypothetical protein
MQSLIIRLPADKARRIIGIVDKQDSAYESIDEFIRVAVENQLTMEGNGEELTLSDTSDVMRTACLQALANKSAASKHSSAPQFEPKVLGRAPDVPPVAPSSEDLLRLPTTEGLGLRAPVPQSELALSSFTNRLLPLIVGPRALANLSAEGSPSVDLFLDLTAKASRTFGLRLRAEDDAANRRGRLRRSTAFPVGDDESKSLIRYRNCFMFVPDKKGGFVGPLLDLQLVTVDEGRVFLTETGASFAVAPSPAIDEVNGLDVLSDEHRHLLSEAIAHLPSENVEINQFLAALEATSGAQDDVDKELGKLHHGWSEAQVVSHRAAMVGRLRDLAVIDVETDPRTIIVPGSGYDAFMKILTAVTKSG